VMAHESFENSDTADALNASFVSVKVDRDERPDVDAVYMEAVQAITGSGGWPMSVFLTPDRRPFFGGTYFPPDDRHGTPSFRTVLAALTDVWTNRRHQVEEQADELSGAIASRSVIARPPGRAPTLGSLGGDDDGVDLLEVATTELRTRFDRQWGGFGPAPKFPTPTLIDIALRHGLRHAGDDRDGSVPMAVTTLDAMAAGGIHDHLGGGFARYSTDTQWLVPHFEKMLYDQAGLLRAYLHGWQATGRPDYLAVADDIVGYVTRDLTSSEGGVFSAEDADSEGVEGKFYVWTLDQAAAAITGGESGPVEDPAAILDAVTGWFDITAAGNFEATTILRRPVGAPLR
ncbi:MAG: thioredoxin domain-containing protein, partial [Acidimicrobiales bacterium]